MTDHLRFAGQGPDTQERALRDIITATPVLIDALERLQAMDLPDAWMVSGAIYNAAWNHLTGRPPLAGINDIDLFYCDPADVSYEAEDLAIKAAEAAFADLPLPVQLRNQARVHLWYPAHFGQAYPELASSREAIGRFATIAHAVGARLGEGGELELHAPFGLDDLFSFRLAPNHRMNNRETHERKAARAMAQWPELRFEPW